MEIPNPWLGLLAPAPASEQARPPRYTLRKHGPDLPGEQWRPVVGWGDLYEVSNWGRVRSLPRVDVYGRNRPGVLLRPYVGSVTLCRAGQRRCVYVHSLVAKAFKAS